MKQILFLFIAALLLGTLSYAQPTTITWQGKLLDASGNAINQNNVAMTFTMFDASTGGNQLWPASGVVTKTVDVVHGLYSVQLGTGTGDDIAFTASMFNGKTPWLEVKVGTETLPRTEIAQVPFALISNDLSASGWEKPGMIGETTPNTGRFISLETESLKVTTDAGEGKVLVSDTEGNASWQTPQYQSPGTAPGQMLYWNGTAWVTVGAGQEGQFLRFTNSSPVWATISEADLLNIGDSYQGGIIAYFLQPGDVGYDPSVRHGLIAAPYDHQNAAQWGCYGTETGATQTAMGTGANNTGLIVANCSQVNIAAAICSDLELNGYNDWYLPSKDELNVLYINRAAIGGFTNGFYASSSELNGQSIWVHFFQTGEQSIDNKTTFLKVRAVRAF